MCPASSFLTKNMNTKTQTQYTYTTEQFNRLTKSEKAAILRIIDYVTGETPSTVNDKILSDGLNFWRPTTGCVPEEEVRDNLHGAVRYKYSALYTPAMMAAEVDLERRGITLKDNYALELVIDASCDDRTHVAIIAFGHPVCYEHHWSKAWKFHFAELKDLAGEFLRIKQILVAKVVESHRQHHPIHVVVAGGLVQEIRDIPPGIEVKVVDYDIEAVDDLDPQISPLDGAACSIRRFNAQAEAIQPIPA
jgi:hypothetical protein